jgi:hypothetical protein
MPLFRGPAPSSHGHQQETEAIYEDKLHTDETFHSLYELLCNEAVLIDPVIYIEVFNRKNSLDMSINA